MSKQYFFMKLVPPRATFPGDMTEAERALMMEHARYTREKFEEGKVLIYGPVMDPAGAYGMGVFEAENEAEVRAIMESDPSVTGGLNRFEIHPMRIGGAQGPKS
jgi:uncharacterized protein